MSSANEVSIPSHGVTRRLRQRSWETPRGSGRPARRRTQAVVDRRFNQRKYDAAKTIQAFSTRRRDEIDLDTLSTELLVVVDQTMEPTRVSLWLRPAFFW